MVRTVFCEITGHFWVQTGTPSQPPGPAPWWNWLYALNTQQGLILRNYRRRWFNDLSTKRMSEAGPQLGNKH